MSLRRQYMDYLKQNQDLANFLANTKPSELDFTSQKQTQLNGYQITS